MVRSAADLRRRLVAGAWQRDVNPFVDAAAQPLRFVQYKTPERRVIGVSHVWKARSEPVIVWTDQRAAALQVDVIAQHNQRATSYILR